jgi:cyanophycin synthetase
MDKARFRIFHGPSERHDEACLECSFVDDGTKQPRVAEIGAVLASLDLPKLERPGAGNPTLTAAVERLACQLMDKPVPPRSRSGSEDGTGWVAIAFPDHAMARDALSLSHRLLTDPDIAPDLAGKAIAGFLAKAGKVNEINLIAQQLASGWGHFVRPLNNHGRIYQIGMGSASLHCVELGSERDAITGQELARQKPSTISLLNRLGLPTTNAGVANNPSEAHLLARRIGFPCVVKPTAEGKGRGVATSIRNEDQLVPAVRQAAGFGGFPILIENHVDGEDHRLMVIEGELLWAYRLTPPQVTGDGATSIEGLVERENRHRHETRHDESAHLKPIPLDEATARFVADQYGCTLDAVPKAGQVTRLAGQANIARGGTLEDVTSQCHPDIRALAIECTRNFRVSAMGIDLITTDISRSWREVDCAIVEVNCTPGISGLGDGALALRSMIPHKNSGWIPTVVIIGDDDFQSQQGEVMARLLEGEGLRCRKVGYDLAAGDEKRRQTTVQDVMNTLFDPDVDAAVICGSEEAIRRSGYPLNRCDVLIAQQADALPKVERFAEQAIAGAASKSELTRLAKALAAKFLDPAKGGSVPVLERLSGTKAGILCRRFPALPREWFWSQCPGGAAHAQGLITWQDVFDALARSVEAELDLQPGTCRINHAEGAIGQAWETAEVELSVAATGTEAEALDQALDQVLATLNRLFEPGVAPRT